MRGSISSAMMRLFCIIASFALFAAAQVGTSYTITTSVTSPPPVPGQPFHITWSGGTNTSTVFLVLNYFSPSSPDQYIVYGKTQILAGAPNNGSFVWNVPNTILPGKYIITIADNPLIQSSQTGIFTIEASQVTALPVAATTSSVIGSSSTGMALETYSGFRSIALFPTNSPSSGVTVTTPSSTSPSSTTTRPTATQTGGASALLAGLDGLYAISLPLVLGLGMLIQA